MCIQIYRRCICGHREKHGAPKRCEQAKKASRSWCFISFTGPRLDGKGYCAKKKTDSFGVPEPCRECKTEGGYAYYDGGSAIQTWGAQGLVPLPPTSAHFSSPRSMGHHGQVSLSRSDAQQPQVYHERPRRPSKYKDPNPRTPPPLPSNSANKARNKSEKYVEGTMREAEKVSRDTRKKAILGHSDNVDDIRSRAIANAKAKEARRPEPLSLYDGNSIPDHPAPLNPRKHHHASPPAGPHEAVYPDLRLHPATKSDVELAVHYEALAAGVHHREGTRQSQDNTSRRAAFYNPDLYRMEPQNRGQRQYATRAEVVRNQQQSHAAPSRGYSLDESCVFPTGNSPPESQISAFNITQKLPYRYQRG